MQLLVGAAGKGSRFKELTKDQPKHLIEINGKPFLGYLLEHALRAGFDEIILVVGYKAELIEKYIKNNFPEKITVVNQFKTLGKEKYGSACVVECAEEYLNGDFVMLYGDSLFSVQDLRRFMINDNLTYIAGSEQDQPEKYGVLIQDEQHYLKEIEEKPEQYLGNIVNAGLYRFTPEIFKKINRISPSPRGEYELTDAISSLARDKKVKVLPLKDYWLDLGAPEDIPKLEKFIKTL